MHETDNNPNRLPDPEILHISPDMQFAIMAALEIGGRMLAGRAAGLEVSAKLDRTLVSNIDVDTNVWFNEQVDSMYGGQAIVLAEEVSQAATEPLTAGEDERTWIIDSVDGTGEFVAIYRDRNTGEPIDPTQPLPEGADPELIPDMERTTCTAIAMLKNGRLWLAAVYNPFQNRLVIADRDLDGSFLVDQGAAPGDTAVWAQRLAVNERSFMPMPPTWDRAVWEGGAVDATLLEQAAGTAPLNHYSAVDQAVNVALGNSIGAVFAGDTIHDIAPAAAIVAGAGGIITKPDGRLVDLDSICNELSGGMVYTNRIGNAAFLDSLLIGDHFNLFLANHAGVEFPVTWDLMRNGVPLDAQPENIVNYELDEEGRPRTDRISVYGFGYQRGDYLNRGEIRRLKKITDGLGVPAWKYKSFRHINQWERRGIAHIADPDRVIVPADRSETGEPLTASQLVLEGLRSAVRTKLQANAIGHIDTLSARSLLADM